MTDPGLLLAAYDEQLRGEPETRGADAVERLGPLWLVTYPAGSGYITYRDLDGADADEVRRFVGATLAHFAAEPDVTEVEWKTRAHDRAPGLHEALVDHGFAPEDPESIMIGPAETLAVDVPLPDGVTLRRITDEADVRAMATMSDEVFGDSPSHRHAEQLLLRQRLYPDMELWVAEADGQIVSAGRLEPEPGTEFAGIWGGSTRREWRGRGIYRALTAERARSALRLGKRYVQSDSTDFSRPILERSGLVKVSTTTPYVWRRHV
jgi:hypothetical protein